MVSEVAVAGVVVVEVASAPHFLQLLVLGLSLSLMALVDRPPLQFPLLLVLGSSPLLTVGYLPFPSPTPIDDAMVVDVPPPAPEPAQELAFL